MSETRCRICGCDLNTGGLCPQAYLHKPVASPQATRPEQVLLDELGKLEHRQLRDEHGREIKGALWVKLHDVAGMIGRWGQPAAGTTPCHCNQGNGLCAVHPELLPPEGVDPQFAGMGDDEQYQSEAEKVLGEFGSGREPAEWEQNKAGQMVNASVGITPSLRNEPLPAVPSEGTTPQAERPLSAPHKKWKTIRHKSEARAVAPVVTAEQLAVQIVNKFTRLGLKGRTIDWEVIEDEIQTELEAFRDKSEAGLVAAAWKLTDQVAGLREEIERLKREPEVLDKRLDELKAILNQYPAGQGGLCAMAEELFRIAKRFHAEQYFTMQRVEAAEAVAAALRERERTKNNENNA